MSTSPLSSHKLHALLSQLWSSPVFGTSYSSTVAGAHITVLQTINQVYHQSLATLDHVLQLAHPTLSAAERDVINCQVCAKSVAFCGAVVADEITDVELMRAATTAIALVSWADQTMDRGDDAMVTAIEIVAGTRTYVPQAANEKVQHYVAALGWFLREVAVIARPEDASFVLRYLIDNTLAREARAWRLSAFYQRMPHDMFWNRFANEIGSLAVHDVGFIAVTAMAYALHRQRNPALPPLAEILHNSALMEGPLRAGEAMIRMLDDIGDRVIDAGENEAWGMFALNLWNQNDSRHVNAFLEAAGVDAPGMRQDMFDAQADRDSTMVVNLWLEHVQNAYTALPDDMRQRYEVFLRLSQRVIEAGFVNMLGDDVLAEQLQERARGA